MAHTTVIVDRLPQCDLCECEAHYDARTVTGQWGYLCDQHYSEYGVGLGLGKGQELLTKGQDNE